MKRYEKLCSCLMIVALCVAGLALGGCKKAREKKHKLSVATGAVVNSMMMTNPMGALFGEQSDSAAAQDSGVQSDGCPDRLPVNHLAMASIVLSPLFLHKILRSPMPQTAW